MKIIKRLFVILLLLNLFACSGNKTGSKTINNEEFYSYNGILYPIVFGNSEFSDEDLINLNVDEAPIKITTYVDAVRYLSSNEYKNSYEMIQAISVF